MLQLLLLVLLKQSNASSFELLLTEQIRDNASNVFYYDCLLYHVLDDTSNWNEIRRFEIVFSRLMYCFRPVKQNDIQTTKISDHVSQTLKFKEMRSASIQSKDLLLWSAPIDLVERYQEYLEQLNESFSFQIYHNCTPPWFGPICQYTFNVSMTFNEIVKATFKAKTGHPVKDYVNFIHLSCYIHLECNRGPGEVSCLDWREICDGYVHCLDGQDEAGCFELEINECRDDEFRCRNGQCIPSSFFDDSPFNSDCLDSSDEYDFRSYLPFLPFINCANDPAFRCEEADRPLPGKYGICGDGERIYTFFITTTIEACRNMRTNVLDNALYSYKHNLHLSNDCWFSLFCATKPGTDSLCTKTFCKKGWQQCEVNLSNVCLPDIIVFPFYPVLDGHIRFAFNRNETIKFTFNHKPYPLPHYLCFDPQRLPFYPVTKIIGNFTCSPIELLGLKTISDVMLFLQSALTINILENNTLCRHSALYQCPNTSKCIAKHRLVDGNFDCFGGADENYNGSCTLSDRRFRFFCESENKCRHGVASYDFVAQCAGGEDERTWSSKENGRFVFQHLCNRYEHIKPDENNETDETHCEEWPCDNLYTRCDGAWSCSNGSDERYCGKPWCMSEEHPCISPENQTAFCLPYDKVNNGIIDCLGGSDERHYCTLHGSYLEDRYRCQKDNTCIRVSRVCWPKSCLGENVMEGVCRCPADLAILERLSDTSLRDLAYPNFRLEHSTEQNRIEPLGSSVAQRTPESAVNQIRPFQLIEVDPQATWLCNRGIPIMNGKSSKCLCPPSYFGDRCEFQSQRVSLTVQFNFVCAPDCRVPFGMIISLLDNDDIIHSQEQIMYIPTRECGNKTNIYLLYHSRPKNLTKQYHIRIDAYNKLHLSYHSSWILPIPFLFLPVNRIATRLTIPSLSSTQSSLDVSCSPSCAYHGKCTRALNAKESFCRCSSGWSGKQCNVPFICSCSKDSLCVSSSTCVCPLSKRGPRCYLQSMCHTYPCKNGGICIPNDQQLFEDRFTCICPDAFSGPLCEHTVSKILITLSGDLVVPQMILCQFITVRAKADPLKTTIVGRIPFDKDFTIVHQDLPFHLLFAQIDKDYYLALAQLTHIPSVNYALELTSANRCPHIDEVLDAQTSRFHTLRRVKYVHVACRERKHLMCFRDDEASFMCICNQERQANCFSYDFNETHDCREMNGCENGGRCYKGRDCPTSITCLCPECYYGTRCQFSTKGVSLSLDVILGYQIRRHLPFTQQSAALKFSISLTIITTMLGLVSSIFSCMIFQRPGPREVGCGLYLLTISITSILTIILFAYKLLFLILSQLSILSNRASLHIHCVSLDFLLRSLPTIGDWLAASVAVDRAFSITKGVKFDKRKSRHFAPWIIAFIILGTLTSLIQEPFHRHVVDDEQEERTWCLVQYSSRMNAYNSAVNIFHFLCPFALNFISAAVIIITTAFHRSAVHKKSSYEYHLRKMLQQHKHLLVSPLVLVILGIPRLIISFNSGCMKSARNPWWFLISYYVPFIPTSFNFIIFVLPSKMYIKEFKKVGRRVLRRTGLSITHCSAL